MTSILKNDSLKNDINSKKKKLVTKMIGAPLVYTLHKITRSHLGTPFVKKLILNFKLI